jgi:hypothetical protein
MAAAETTAAIVDQQLRLGVGVTPDPPTERHQGQAEERHEPQRNARVRQVSDHSRAPQQSVGPLRVA